MSNEFILSQMEYYKNNLNCGPSRDWNLISGLYQHYRSVAVARGLIA
ncbi:hypothetical protein Xoosp13_82 [Xanthomonas phage Xoo-sp13]|nr:hypothetical protein Xoosp13_82 [Xanthomonas phage Xoo-sp13]